MNWPTEAEPAPRADWRDRFALGTDLALIGVVVTVAGLPLLTLPAALAAGSLAVRHRYTTGRLPGPGPLLRGYGRAVLPGIPFAVAAALLLVDLIALSRGWVPGGTPVLVLTAAIVTWLAGVATLILVAIGREEPSPARWAWARATSRPWSALAPALTGALAFFLALSVPATIPLVLGFHLFAAHMISDRLAPGFLSPASPEPAQQP